MYGSLLHLVVFDKAWHHPSESAFCFKSPQNWTKTKRIHCHKRVTNIPNVDDYWIFPVPKVEDTSNFIVVIYSFYR